MLTIKFLFVFPLPGILCCIPSNPYHPLHNPYLLAINHRSAPKKCAQESSEESKSGIYWERCPHLTTALLSWLLDHPDDCAILFNETKGGTTKSQAREKNKIKTTIASVVFKEDNIYGEAYSQHPERFVITVNSHLMK